MINVAPLEQRSAADCRARLNDLSEFRCLFMLINAAIDNGSCTALPTLEFSKRQEFQTSDIWIVARR